jgi:gramicidin S synthase 2/tyrocidine synthetase-3
MTGDLARWQADGNIEFLGRNDSQVKIRGFRIEPGEIESILLKKKEISDAIVIVKRDKNAENYLCAYFVSTRKVPTGELREYLDARLPDYMIPSYFYQVKEIPLSINGKVDREKLSAYESNLDTGIDYIAPNTDMEKKIAAIWMDLLDLEKVGILDNFFHIGGNSLKVMLLYRRLKEELNLDISVVSLFEHATIGSFIQYLSEQEKQERMMVHKEIERADEISKARDRKRKRIVKRGIGAPIG